ncbi:MAG: hypothetical protein A2X36_05015 [Elusimicrobia bacterium GWA2_69_24]|nr:MAG: hypothetical protein A2X36_05015 [Elusimicrobia bacterium GWA2_69_24]HBH04902.1 hypothetical protein [Candidatus Rokubacteria bacterium]
MRARRTVLGAAVFANAKAKRLAIRLTKWTGKSPDYVHPKHLLPETDEQYWYLPHVAPRARLLDVGCGNAMHTLKAAARCAVAVGIDRSEESLRVGRRASAGPRPGTVALVRGDVETGLPFGDAGFDTVLCMDLLEHVHARQAVLTEIRRVLRPGGALLLAVPNRATTWKRRLERAGLFHYSDPDHKVEYTFPELEAELDRGGFVVASRYPSVYDTPLVGLIDVVGGVSLALYRRLSRLRRRLAARYPEEDAGFYVVCRAR